MPTVGKILRIGSKSRSILWEITKESRVKQTREEGDRWLKLPQFTKLDHHVYATITIGIKKIGITRRSNIKTIFQGAPCGDGRLLVELNPGSHGGNEHDYMIISYIFYYYYIILYYKHRR